MRQSGPSIWLEWIACWQQAVAHAVSGSAHPGQTLGQTLFSGFNCCSTGRMATSECLRDFRRLQNSTVCPLRRMFTSSNLARRSLMCVTDRKKTPKTIKIKRAHTADTPPVCSRGGGGLVWPFGQYFRGIRVRRILLLASVFRVALLFVHDAHNSSFRHGRKTTCVDSAPKTVQRNPFCYIAGNLG